MTARIGIALAAGLAALALAGCSVPQRNGLAPVTTHTGEAPLPPSSGGAVVVAAGDTVYEIARRYGVPTRDIIEINGLSPPYTLHIGQRLLLPMARFHTVQRGDTLYSISRMYQVDMAELAQGNDLQPPYGIRIGQMLRLPGGIEAGEPEIRTAGIGVPLPRQKPGSTPTPALAPAPALAEQPSLPASGTAMASVALLPPPMAKPEPVATGSAAVVAASLPQPSAPAILPPAGKPRPETAVAAVQRPQPSLPPPPVQEVPPRSGSQFEWPVRGPILSAFGPKPGGLHNDGLNIEAPHGTPVVAAEDGVVAYAGNELRGFGNLLLIRHADRWISAYAHLDQLLVERGALVRRGQKIGTVGSTGSVTSPQLHFELRQGSRAVDPRQHLAPAGGGKVSRAAFQAGRPDPG